MPAISFDPAAIDWDLTLITGRAVFLVLCFAWAAVAFTRWRHTAERDTAQGAQQSFRVLERLAEIEARIEAGQGVLAELAERIAMLNTATSGNTASPSYQIAIRMARSGAARDELMTSCGLTRQEAELVERLHAPAQRERLVAVG